MNTRLIHVDDWLEVARNARWSVKGMAQICGASERTLQMHFRNKMLMTPKEWVTRERMQLAKQYLREGSLVKETASAVAYKSADHFSAAFKSYWGVWPTQLKSAADR